MDDGNFGTIGGESFKKEVEDSGGRRHPHHPAAGQHWRAAKNAVVLSDQAAVQSDGRGQAAIHHWKAAKSGLKMANNQ